MCSSPYDSKTYSFIDLNTVNFTGSQAENDKIFENLMKIYIFSPAFPVKNGNRSSTQRALR